jgi:hypothetical protein
MSCESLFLPDGVNPLFFHVLPSTPFRFAHRARWAAAIFARAANDIRRFPDLRGSRDGEVSKIETNCFSNCSILRRIETAFSKLLRDSSMGAVGSCL